MKKNVPRIKKLIGKYLEDPETQTNNEIDDMLESCFKTLIKHFEMQDYEDKCAKHNYDATDSSEEKETLFNENKKEDEEDEEEEENLKEEEVLNKPKPNSYWGKNRYRHKQDLVKGKNY